ncbi:hypothetical protein DF141_26085 [Burkholderia cenocepacia]|nr:hypothetical protein DF141_26085 [Burkholderia cenocepacia]RQV16211.1 hypothetical protein DF039_18810 [Burkholderia cenocepacia]RQZ89596.1 hypothetical protein DF058_25915 [Burkholderia cenocepacia]RRA10070.1 hypothetical protein DF059_26405 [Burkholderia cenocepacia]
MSAVHRRHAVRVLLALIACPPARRRSRRPGPVSPCAENSITIRRRPSKVGDVRTGVGAHSAYRSATRDPHCSRTGARCSAPHSGGYPGRGAAWPWPPASGLPGTRQSGW